MQEDFYYYYYFLKTHLAVNYVDSIQYPYIVEYENKPVHSFPRMSKSDPQKLKFAHMT